MRRKPVRNASIMLPKALLSHFFSADAPVACSTNGFTHRSRQPRLPQTRGVRQRRLRTQVHVFTVDRRQDFSSKSIRWSSTLNTTQCPANRPIRSPHMAESLHARRHQRYLPCPHPSPAHHSQSAVLVPHLYPHTCLCLCSYHIDTVHHLVDRPHRLRLPSAIPPILIFF